MHHRSSRPLLALLALILASLACLIAPPSFLTNSQVTCEHGDFLFQAIYNCTCKSNPANRVDNVNIGFDNYDEFSNLDPDFTIAGCPVVSLPESSEASATEPPIAEVPTEEPTDAPTEEATEEATEEPLQPYLTGDATFCDLTSRYVNFTIDPNASSAGSPSFFFNDQPANCTVANANSKVLTCLLPLDAAFPLTVTARTGERELNNFTFDGAICAYSDPAPPVNNDEDPPTDPCAGITTPTSSCP